MVEKCVRCGAKEDQIRLFDTIYDGKANCICERCSIIENVSILERPDSDKILESNRMVNVYERMKRLTGMVPEKKESEERKNRLEELRKNPHLETPQKKTPELIDHFHWEIMKCRRRKGLSHNQLGEAIGEPGFSIDMIEKGNLGENAEILIKKLENFFNIRLIKLSSLDLMKKDEKKIEERAKLIEARREELRMIKEKDSKDIDNLLGGAELLKKEVLNGFEKSGD